jgi:toxin ParE1/3/4
VRYVVRYAPEARAQLDALYAYIARQASPDTAWRFTDAIVDRCESLCDYALRGTPRDDIRPGLRTLPFRRRVTIAYAIAGSQVTILAIFYGGQNVAAMLSADDGES